MMTHSYTSAATRRPLRAALATLALLAACAPPRTTPAPDRPPTVTRETRGLWIATVGNIDWPSKPGLPAAEQQRELVDLLEKARAAGLNTVVFHVRPAGDAVYRSELEPWGAMLTGTQGQDPGWDPLAVAVREAHARGLELHAWFNPYRAGRTADSAALAPTQLFRTRRDLGRVYGTQLWFDPGEPEVQAQSLRVIADVVRRYDVDGVHLDDYFYPYPQNDASGRAIDFPDSATYARYGAGRTRDDWRRANVDGFVERLYATVHGAKPWVKVGISPFGIWRPGNPASVAGLDAYAQLFADSRGWLQRGWVDYLAPQLYWPIGSAQQSYPALLDWWVAQNAKGRHVWPGLAAYRLYATNATRFGPTEIVDQIRLARERAGASGHILYNANSTLARNGGALAASLAGGLYAQPALPPASPWLGGSTSVAAPSIAVARDTLTIAAPTGAAPRWWVVRALGAGGWTTRILFGDARTLPLAAPTRVLVQAVDEAGGESAVAEWVRHE